MPCAKAGLLWATKQKQMLDELDIAKEKATDGDFSALDEFEEKYGFKGVFDRKK